MLIRFAYLAILWLFVFGAISVVRSDMFGARVEADAPGRKERRNAQKQAKKASKPGRGTPTKVVVLDGPSAGDSAALAQAPAAHRPRPRRRDPARRRLRLHPARPDRLVR